MAKLSRRIRSLRGTPEAFGVALFGLLLFGLSARAQGQPLDPLNPTERQVLVEPEISSDVGVVGQSYGPPVSASYSASGTVGTLVIPIESHEQLRAGFLEPIPGTFTPIVIEIDLTDFSAATQSASGSVQSGPLSAAFLQHPLGTATVAGYMLGADVPTAFCTSQQQIDDLCAVVPLVCGATCVFVPGAPYDPNTGEINLVGSETQQGCDGGVCFGPFEFFTQRGDLRLTEPGATSSCGDGSTDAGNGEECDDGNTTSFDGCSSFCQLEGELIPTVPFWGLLALAAMLVGTSGRLMRRRLGQKG